MTWRINFRGFMMRKGMTPCSLCGGSPIIKKKDPVHRSTYRFRCTGCGLTIDSGYPTREEAMEAWEQINAPKLRSIHGFEIPPGYTLVPSELFKQLCDYVKQNNFTLFRSLAPFNIWHYNSSSSPAQLSDKGQTSTPDWTDMLPHDLPYNTLRLIEGE